MRIELERLRSLNKPEQITVTEHVRRRLLERGIAVNDIVRCIEEGEIIKQYEDDKPFPSCLILGKTENMKPLHVVVSHDDAWIYLITAYYPDSSIWEPDFRAKKEYRL